MEFFSLAMDYHMSVRDEKDAATAGQGSGRVIAPPCPRETARNADDNHRLRKNSTINGLRNHTNKMYLPTIKSGSYLVASFGDHDAATQLRKKKHVCLVVVGCSKLSLGFFHKQ